MNRKNQTYKLVAAALLTAIGIIIPTFSPFKIQLEPASFTLASHVAIFIAMFISPTTAIIVSLGTTLGFLLGGFLPIIVLRALTHVVFASIGGYILHRKPDILKSFPKATVLSFGLGIIHALCEVAVVTPFYFGASQLASSNESGFVKSVIVLVGLGTLVHSMVDFGISQAIWKPLNKVINVSVLSNNLKAGN